MWEVLSDILNITSFCFVSGMTSFMVIFIAVKILRGDKDEWD